MGALQLCATGRICNRCTNARVSLLWQHSAKCKMSLYAWLLHYTL